jgi:hypothetical protein
MGSTDEFFAASAGVAGALIGLLFVAVSVAPERVLGPDAQEVHTVRAAATLTAFTNALAISLFNLIPGYHPGVTTTIVASVGLAFVIGALLRLTPLARRREIRPIEMSYLIGLLAVFAAQLDAGIELIANSHDRSNLRTVCVMVILCFLIGIARAWELVGGPEVGLVTSIRRRRHEHNDAEDA